ncbi:MAG: thiamine phosphate synthase [Thermoanaerobaculaceae bacterium]|jgi:thiamine-phosphate pyrophosphorylase
MRGAVDYSLYLVTDRGLARGRPIEHVVSAAVEGGVSVVQIREKECGAAEFLALACRLRASLEGAGVPLVVNDRVDVALACGAAGVHVGQEDLPCEVVRRLVGDSMLLGVSVATAGQAAAAERAGADYVSVSPIFLTPTKPDACNAVGLEGLSEIRSAVRLPVVAIGGINAANAPEVMRAGADGVCVVSAIMAAPDPRRAAAELRSAVGTVGRRPRL